MTPIVWAAAALALLLFGYLVYALLFPEKLS